MVTQGNMDLWWGTEKLRRRFNDTIVAFRFIFADIILFYCLKYCYFPPPPLIGFWRCTDKLNCKGSLVSVFRLI